MRPGEFYRWRVGNARSLQRNECACQALLHLRKKPNLTTYLSKPTSAPFANLYFNSEFLFHSFGVRFRRETPHLGSMFMEISAPPTYWLSFKPHFRHRKTKKQSPQHVDWAFSLPSILINKSIPIQLNYLISRQSGMTIQFNDAIHSLHCAGVPLRILLRFGTGEGILADPRKLSG